MAVIAFGDPTRASVGILDVAHHTPKIEIKKIENGKEKTIVKYQGKDLYQRSLTISLPNKSFDLSMPSRYYSFDMQKDKKDFRWCLDMESDLFQKQLYLQEDKLFTKIHFNSGTFFTSHLLDGKYTTLKVIEKTKKKEENEKSKRGKR
ncbi:MAG: hypothetical protein HY819_17325 [Acidobacteria bacterium]|nr:hypothetical protein [Acidobacteriota bacterium]